MTLPDDFVQYTRPLMGDSRWRRFVDAIDELPPVSIRLNPAKRPPHISAQTLEPVPWCREGYYLSERPVFTADPLFHAGTYYVQEAASMFLDCVLKQYVKEPVLMLDLCAAPGGKSTLARAVLPTGSMLVSNEPIRRRANILSENMQKWGHTDVIVTSNYPSDFGRSKLLFDVILADVPCSGEGMFRKNSEAVAQWSVAGVMKCSALQRSIVTDIWDNLRPGGLLIYSTCTFNTKENEENVRFIADSLGAEILPVDTDEDWGISGSLLPDFTAPVYRFIPGISRSEGLFIAVLRKKGDHRLSSDRGKSLWSSVNEVKATPLRVLFSGMDVGRPTDKNTPPSQALAMSVSAYKNNFPMVEVDYDRAMAYLCREAITLPEGIPKGYILLTYKGQPLGFVKNIGNRANNLYPSEWRIRNRNI